MNIRHKHPSIYIRGIAYMIDEVIINIARAIFITIGYYAFISHKMNAEEIKNILQNISNNFKAENITLYNVYKALNYNHIVDYFIILIAISFFISPIYIVIMTHFHKWKATHGKRFCKIIILKKNLSPPTMTELIIRITLSVLGFILPVLIYSFVVMDYNIIAVLTGILWVFWYDISAIAKVKISIYDWFSGTYVFYGTSEDL